MSDAATRHLIRLVLLSFMSAFAYIYVNERLSWFVAGMGVGTLAHDFDAFRMVIRLWPAVSQVLDYSKIDELLDQPRDR